MAISRRHFLAAPAMTAGYRLLQGVSAGAPLPADRQANLRAGIPADRERAVLAAWRESQR